MCSSCPYMATGLHFGPDLALVNVTAALQGTDHFSYIFRDWLYVRVPQSLGRVYVSIGVQCNPKDIADSSGTQNEEKHPKKFIEHTEDKISRTKRRVTWIAFMSSRTRASRDDKMSTATKTWNCGGSCSETFEFLSISNLRFKKRTKLTILKRAIYFKKKKSGFYV